jgi:hypothetical protein
MKINEIEFNDDNFSPIVEDYTIRYDKGGEVQEMQMPCTQEMWERELKEIRKNPEWKCVYVMGIKQKDVVYPPGSIVGNPTFVKIGISKNPEGRMPNVERALQRGKGLPFLYKGAREWEPMQLIGHSVPTPHAEEIERAFQRDYKFAMLKGKKDWYMAATIDPEHWVCEVSRYKAEFDFKYMSGPLTGIMSK